MTGATEAKLCREAEICYSTMNLVTDYDVWHEEEQSVTVDLILENLRLNIHNAKAIVKKALGSLPAREAGSCSCGRALENTFVTNPDLVPADVKRTLRPLIGKYMSI